MTNKRKSLKEASKSKKISFFSAILIVIGSSIGAGIFLKSKSVLDNSHGNLILAIFAWIMAAVAIIAMALALVEVSSARNDNLSVIGWCQTFNSKFIAQAAKNFMFYIYLPLTYFFMPFYAILQFQDALVGFGLAASFGTNFDWLIWMLIALVIAYYFLVVAGYSSKLGNIHNLLVTFFKFIPLVVAALLGYFFIFDQGSSAIHSRDFDPQALNSNTLVGLSPFFGIFLSMAAIFFAYDGFYVSAGMQSEMKEPKRTPLAIMFGLIITTIIYLLVAISLSLNGSGNFYGFGTWLTNKGYGWVFGVINLFIAFGILGIINGFSIWAPRFAEELIKIKALPLAQRYLNKLNARHPKVGIVYTLVIVSPVVLLFTLIGALTYLDIGAYGNTYGSKMGALYSFCDLMANWTSVIAFAFIALAILGALKNRKSQKIKTEKKKYFVISAWVTILIVFISLAFNALQPFFDLVLIAHLEAIEKTEIVSRLMTVVVFFIFIVLMLVPSYYQKLIPSAFKKRLSLKRNTKI